MKKLITTFCIALLLTAFMAQNNFAESRIKEHSKLASFADSAAARRSVVELINRVITASTKFDINAVADLYTPNALVADEEPPFSWNGTTAGVQWIDVVEKTCKDLKIKEFKSRIGHISTYLQTDESVYVIVPVTYTGEIKGDPFEESGAFTFVFRVVNGQWLIKSQVWLTRRGL